MSKKPLMRTLEEVTLVLTIVVIANIFFLTIKTIFPPVVTLIILFACLLFVVHLLYKANKKNSK